VNDEIVIVCGTVFIMAEFRNSQENFDDGDKQK
jgi:hypothetical protein